MVEQRKNLIMKFLNTRKDVYLWYIIYLTRVNNNKRKINWMETVAFESHHNWREKDLFFNHIMSRLTLFYFLDHYNIMSPSDLTTP